MKACVFGLACLLFASSTAAAECNKDTFRIALDIGHDKTKPGATSARGITEFTYNRDLAELLLPALQAVGYKAVFLIGESGEPMALERRSQIAREQKADLFISLHHDSAQAQYFSTWMFGGKAHPYSDRFRGYSIFVSSSSRYAKESLTLATDLGRALEANGLIPSLHHAEQIPGENRVLLNPQLGIYRFDELAVLRGATMPALLLESGLIVNRSEEQEIRSGQYHPKILRSIVKAVEQYCRSP